MDSLATLAELFIGIAGFSGIVVALSGSSIARDPLDRFRVLSLLFTTLSGAVFAVFPIVLNDAGLPSERTWRLASGGYSVILGLLVAWGIRQRFALPKATLASLHPLIWILSLGGQGVGSVVVAGVSGGWAGPRAAAFYLSVLLYFLAISTVLFVRLLVVRPGDSPAA